MADILNLVMQPLTPGYHGYNGITTESWYLNRTPAAPARYGDADSRGNPRYGLTVGQSTNAVNTEITGVEPGDTVRLYLDIRSGNLHAGLYWDRLAAPADGDHGIDTDNGSAFTYADLVVPEGDGILWLKLWGMTSASVEGTRLSKIEPGAEDDGLGIFDGFAEDTELRAFEWDGDPYKSHSRAVDLTAPVVPDPPSAGDLVARVLRFAGMTETERRIEIATEHVDAVTAYVYGYTRGRGFTPDPETGHPMPKLDVANVIVAASARLTTNPRQLSYYSAGDYSERPAVLAGWTLLERAVLNNYRRTWA